MSDTSTTSNEKKNGNIDVMKLATNKEHIIEVKRVNPRSLEGGGGGGVSLQCSRLISFAAGSLPRKTGLQTIRDVLYFTPPRFSTNQMRSSIFSTAKNLMYAVRLFSLFHTLDTSLHNMSLTSDRLSEVLQSILPVFDINSLRSEQETALHAFLNGKDVFVNLPKSFGKSIIYQLAPLVSSHLEELSPNSGLGKSDAILVVVSPLISLMKARFPREGPAAKEIRRLQWRLGGSN